MLFLCYPKCSTCKKAEKWLKDNNYVYTVRDIKTDNPTYDELKKWHEISGAPLKRFFNTSGMLYRSMELKDKIPNMSDDDMLKLLASDGMLVKRPLLITENSVLIGFNIKEWETL